MSVYIESIDRYLVPNTQWTNAIPSVTLASYCALGLDLPSILYEAILNGLPFEYRVASIAAELRRHPRILELCSEFGATDKVILELAHGGTDVLNVLMRPGTDSSDFHLYLFLFLECDTLKYGIVCYQGSSLQLCWNWLLEVEHTAQILHLVNGINKRIETSGTKPIKYTILGPMRFRWKFENGRVLITRTYQSLYVGIVVSSTKSVPETLMFQTNFRDMPFTWTLERNDTFVRTWDCSNKEAWMQSLLSNLPLKPKPCKRDQSPGRYNSTNPDHGRNKT